MKADIKLDDDSVEIEGDLKLEKIVSKDLRVVGSLTMVGVGESPANGFTHLVLKPESLVLKTVHIGGVKNFDIRKEIGQNTSDIKQVAIDTKQAATDAKQAGTDAKEAKKQVTQVAAVVTKVAADAAKVGTDAEKAGNDAKVGIELGKRAAADVKKVASDLTQVRGEVKAIETRTNWTVRELRSSMGITVGSLVESTPANTPVQQVVITGNKIVVRTVKHQGTTGTPGSFFGVQVGPLETIDEFDLVADNQNLKKQVIVLQSQVAALEKQVGILVSKVK